jgi:hypothetical protein
MRRSHAGTQLAPFQPDRDETLNAENAERQRSTNGPKLKLGKRQWLARIDHRRRRDRQQAGQDECDDGQEGRVRHLSETFWFAMLHLGS